MSSELQRVIDAVQHQTDAMRQALETVGRAIERSEGTANDFRDDLAEIKQALFVLPQNVALAMAAAARDANALRDEQARTHYRHDVREELIKFYTERRFLRATGVSQERAAAGGESTRLFSRENAVAAAKWVALVISMGLAAAGGSAATHRHHDEPPALHAPAAEPGHP